MLQRLKEKIMQLQSIVLGDAELTAAISKVYGGMYVNSLFGIL